MANELHHSTTTGLDLYALVYTLTGQIRDVIAPAFVTIESDDWDDYDVPMTEQDGAGEYFADFPAGIPAGTYEVAVRLQVGVSPSPTDPVLGTGTILWSGTAELSPNTTTPDNATITAINAKTTNLPSDPADASVIAGSFTTVNTKLDTIDDLLDTEVAAIKTDTAAILADTARMNDQVTLEWSVPAVMEIPESGYNQYRLTLFVRDSMGGQITSPVEFDVVKVRTATLVDMTSHLYSWLDANVQSNILTEAELGKYEIYYRVLSTDTPTALGFAIQMEDEYNGSEMGAAVKSSVILQNSDASADVQAALTAQGYTEERAENLDNLDATVSSRSTYAGGDTPGTTTLLTRITELLTPATIWNRATSALTVAGSIGKFIFDMLTALYSRIGLSDGPFLITGPIVRADRIFVMELGHDYLHSLGQSFLFELAAGAPDFTGRTLSLVDPDDHETVYPFTIDNIVGGEDTQSFTVEITKEAMEEAGWKRKDKFQYELLIETEDGEILPPPIKSEFQIR